MWDLLNPESVPPAGINVHGRIHRKRTPLKVIRKGNGLSLRPTSRKEKVRERNKGHPQRRRSIMGREAHHRLGNLRLNPAGHGLSMGIVLAKKLAIIGIHHNAISFWLELAHVERNVHFYIAKQ